MARFTHPGIVSGSLENSFNHYGSFFDTTSQTATANEIKAMTFNTEDFYNGVRIESNSHIKIMNAGKYNIAFSAQLHYNGGGGSGHTVNIWLAKNGTAISDTNTRIDVNSNTPYQVAAWNFFINANANDYYEIMWSTDNAQIGIDYVAATGSGANIHPAIPSIILTVNQIGS